jgi:predicted Rossmann fold nucleotide-binding protein DprA/Smf involved in DNA uptake
MKTPKEMIKDIKNLLGVELSSEKEVVLAELKLENGTVLTAEEFESGKEVFILTEDEKVSLPKGNYELEDGRELEVLEDGVINSINAYEHKEDEEEEKKMEEHYVSKEEFDSMKEMVMKMKEVLESMKEKKEEEKEMEDKKKEEMAKQELSKPAVEPFKHTPEKKETNKKVLFAQNRQQTTLDIVMNKMFNK